RALELNDYAVIDYATTLEGRPLLEIEPKAPKILEGGTDFWIKLDENTFLKGFSDQLVGMQTGETLDFELTVPDDYVFAEVAKRALHFKVTLKGIKSMQLPELTDEFASQIVQGLTLDQLKATLREQLVTEAERRTETQKH